MIDKIWWKIDTTLTWLLHNLKLCNWACVTPCVQTFILWPTCLFDFGVSLVFDPNVNPPYGLCGKKQRNSLKPDLSLSSWVKFLQAIGQKGKSNAYVNLGHHVVQIRCRRWKRKSIQWDMPHFHTHKKCYNLMSIFYNRHERERERERLGLIKQGKSK